MKRIIFALLLLPQFAYAQYRAGIFSLDMSDDIVQRKMEKTFSQDTTLFFNERPIISGLSISGTAVLNNDNDSFVRVTLVDVYNYEFLVYENYPALSDNLTVTFNNIALETVLLDDIVPQYLKVTLLNASLKLESVNYSTSLGIKNQNVKNPAAIQKAQAQYIVDKLNVNLERRNMTWRAGMTSISEMTFSEKKDMFGGSVPELYGFEHYAGGIFVMPGEYLNTPRNESSNEYVTEWDWRNRHGKNWMTLVKNQNWQNTTCGSCWAHAAVGVLEAYINLYYNRILSRDLSEEELISCTQWGCSGGHEQNAFNYIKTSGIVNETCFPYVAEEQDCNSKCTNPSERIFIEDYGQYTTSEDSMKRQLFRAPITLGIDTWHHSMTIAGYKKVTLGDYIYNGNGNLNETFGTGSLGNVIGRTAWLVKNSSGYQWGDNGYGYIVVDTNNINGHCYLKGRITSLTLTDNDIVCSDDDGDGLYFWGLGPKPAHCPSWVPDTPDGNDNDINYGVLDGFGYLEELPAGETIRNSKTYSDRTIDYRIGIVNGGVLTISGTTVLDGDSRIRVCEGGTLIVDGGTLQNADITLVPGCTVIIRHNGKINMATGKSLEAPQGVIIDIESGEIN